MKQITTFYNFKQNFLVNLKFRTLNTHVIQQASITDNQILTGYNLGEGFRPMEWSGRVWSRSDSRREMWKSNLTDMEDERRVKSRSGRRQKVKYGAKKTKVES